MVAYKINGETLYRRTLYQFCVRDFWYLSKQEKWIDEQQEEYKGALAVYKEYENEKQLIEQNHTSQPFSKKNYRKNRRKLPRI